MKMPAEIAKALQNVSVHATGLVKDKDNKFANYKFVSHDQIKEKVGKLMAESGLTMVADEVRAEVQDKFLKCDYEIWLYHETGVEYGPVHRRIMVAANGPQAFGIAASYVQKYFLRDLLQIPTGEQESDMEPKQDLPEPPKEKVDTAALFKEMKEDLDACSCKQDLDDWVELYKPQKPLLRKAQQEEITSLFNARKDAIKEMING